jgi:hypothetical protein
MFCFAKLKFNKVRSAFNEKNPLWGFFCFLNTSILLNEGLNIKTFKNTKKNSKKTIKNNKNEIKYIETCKKVWYY